MRRRALAALLAAAGLAGLLGRHPAAAQKIDPRRPSTLVVGPPGGASPTARGDARRSGATGALLPSGSLRVAWRKTLGLSIEQPALAGSDGVLAIVTGARGEVIFLDADGEEKARVGAGAAAAGPATLSSDGTVVFTTSAGDAVGVRRASARPRFVTHLGGERNTRGAPLSLDDGGVVVTTATDLVALDAEGNVRSRVSLPEPAAAPLVASGERILAVTSSGAVYAWTPGREPVRVGSFGAPVDGGAALADADTLTAVIEGNHLVDLDLRRGARSTRAVATQGLYLGPPSVRTAPSGSLATLLAYTTTRAFVVSLDASGRETGRAPMAEVSQVALPDGGVAKLEAPAHTGPLVDARGAAAFAGPDGRVGVAQPDGAVELVGELICTKTPRSSGVAGLTALGRGAFAVTCESGAVARITGSDTDGASSSGAAR